VHLGFGPKSLSVPFSISNPIGDSVVVKTIYRVCVLSFSGRETLEDLIKFYMVNVDVFLKMDCCTRSMLPYIVGPIGSCLNSLISRSLYCKMFP